MLRLYKPNLKPYNLVIKQSLNKLERKSKGTSLVLTEGIKQIKLEIVESNTEDILMTNEQNQVVNRPRRALKGYIAPTSHGIC